MLFFFLIEKALMFKIFKYQKEKLEFAGYFTKTSSIFLRIATQYDTSKMNRNHVPIFFITVLMLNFI